MDITSLKDSASATFFVEVAKGPAGAVGFTVVGPASPQYAEADGLIRAMNIQEAAARKGEPMDLTRLDQAQAAVTASEVRTKLMLSKCVVGWQGFKKNGEEVLFSEEGLSEVFDLRKDWARKCIAAIEDEGNFMSR